MMLDWFKETVIKPHGSLSDDIQKECDIALELAIRVADKILLKSS